MRSSHDCKSNCAPSLCYLPCLPKPKEDATGGTVPGPPSPAAVVAEEKPPLVQKIDAAVAAGGDDDDEGCKEVPVAPKSSLKRADCVGSNNAVKRNVKWMDLVGKDLTQVKEFEPSESEDSDWDDEDASPCTCVIL